VEPLSSYNLWAVEGSRRRNPRQEEREEEKADQATSEGVYSEIETRDQHPAVLRDYGNRLFQFYLKSVRSHCDLLYDRLSGRARIIIGGFAVASFAASRSSGCGCER